MYTEQLTQALMLGAPTGPQVLTSTTTINSGSIDLSKVKRAIFDFVTGTFGGTSPTLSAALTLQVSPDNSTWSASTIVTGIPAVTAAGKQATAEIRADQLTAQANNMRYARLQAVCTIGGTSPTIPVVITAQGGESMQGPASQYNDASVVSQTTAA